MSIFFETSNRLNKAIIMYCFIVLCCLLFSFSSQAQIKGDSLKQIFQNEEIQDSFRFMAINKYYLNHTFAIPDTILKLTEFHFALAKKKDLKGEMSKALNERSYAYYIKGDLEKSKDALKESIDLLSKLNDPSGLASVTANLGNLYGAQNQYQEAVYYFTKTLKIFKTEGIKTGEARMLGNLGLIYYAIDSYDLATEHFIESINIYKEVNLNKKTGNALSNLASVFYAQNKYQEAIETGEEAIQILLDNNNKFAVADCYFLLAEAFLAINDKNKAEFYIEKSMEIDESIKNDSRIIERKIFVANMTFDSDVTKATTQAENILKLIKGDTDIKLKVSLYDLLYRCYKAQNKFSASLMMKENYVIYNDSLQRQKNNTAIIREAIHREYEDKLLENKLESERAQTQLKKDYFKRITAIAALGIAMLFLIVFYSRKRIQASHKKRDALLEELERLKNVDTTLAAQSPTFHLDRAKIEAHISRNLNETDWNVLNVLLDDPVISNKEIAKSIFMSVDGVGSSLRRMYNYFEIKDSKYKKISLLMMAIKLSNQ